MATLFERIIRGEIPADIVFQDEEITAFRDINPAAPVHVLVVPNEPIATANGLEARHDAMAGRMLRLAADIAKEAGIAESGYRLIINCNEHGGQEVFHLHLHLVGGRSLGPMLQRRQGGSV
jgi:histidine triad (HIT) family protein